MATGEGWYDVGVMVAKIVRAEFLASHAGASAESTSLIRELNAQLENRLLEIGVRLRTDGLRGEAINRVICERSQWQSSLLAPWYRLGSAVESVGGNVALRKASRIPRHAREDLIQLAINEAAEFGDHLGDEVALAVSEYLQALGTIQSLEESAAALANAHERLRDLARETADDVHVGIITMKEEETTAVLGVLPDTRIVSKQREYNVCTLNVRDGRECRVGVVRCVEQGTGEAQNIAEAFLTDLSPRWLLVVGIAGGAPRDEFSLGDVVISTKVYDLTVEARLIGGQEFQVSGGWMPGRAASLAANLVAMKRELGAWNNASRVGVRPDLSFAADRFSGSTAWQKKVRETLEYHHLSLRSPKCASGPIASSDSMVKDPDLMEFWMTFTRDTFAVEMETAGVYRAVRNKGTALLAIRGISDIVGYKRSREWTEYACKTSASFSRALIDTGRLID